MRATTRLSTLGIMTTHSKLSRFISITALGLSIAAGSVWAATAAAPLPQHDQADPSIMLISDNGSKWAADAPLSRAMTSIHSAVHAEFADVAELDDILADKGLTRKALKKKYLALAKRINNEVAYIVSNCQLEPEADARLHLVLTDLHEGVMAMEGQDELGSRRDGILKVMDALDQYPMYFEDPDFLSVHRCIDPECPKARMNGK